MISWVRHRSFAKAPVMMPVSINVEVTIDAESHPVFSVLLEVSSNKYTPNPFEHLERCPGITTSDPKGLRECRKFHEPPRMRLIYGEICELNEQKRFQYENPEFTQRIRKFLEKTHCWRHVQMSIARLDELMSHMKEEGQQGESRKRLDNDVDGDSSKVEPVTSDTQELDIAEDLSSLSIHPSQESDVGFSSTSDADTVLTTPDATPLSRIDRVLEIEPGSRPETPCPTSRMLSEELVQPINLPSKIENSGELSRISQWPLSSFNSHRLSLRINAFVLELTISIFRQHR